MQNRNHIAQILQYSGPGAFPLIGTCAAPCAGEIRAQPSQKISRTRNQGLSGEKNQGACPRGHACAAPCVSEIIVVSSQRIELRPNRLDFRVLRTDLGPIYVVRVFSYGVPRAEVKTMGHRPKKRPSAERVRQKKLPKFV